MGASTIESNIVQAPLIPFDSAPKIAMGRLESQQCPSPYLVVGASTSENSFRDWGGRLGKQSLANIFNE